MDDLLLAHPVTDAAHLPLAPPIFVIVVASLVVTVAAFGPVRPVAHRGLTRTTDFPIRPFERGMRATAILVLAATLTAGALGPSDPARNLAPVLLIAAGVPVAVVVALLFGPVWRRLDPIDALARALRAPSGVAAPRGPAVSHVWPAVPVALAVAAYLTIYPDALRPATLAASLSGYLLVTLAGCLAFGRRRWLEQVEPIGLALTWFGGLRGRRLAGWTPPRGAGALLGVIGGGLLFGLVRGSARYGEMVFTLGLRATDVVGVVTFALLGAVLVEATARRWDAATVTSAMVPVVAAIVLVFALRDARAIVALDLLPGLLVDPLGRGWTLGGTGQLGPRTLPFELRDLLVAQLALLAGGATAGARVVRLRSAATGAPAGPGVLAIVGALIAAVAALATV